MGGPPTTSRSHRAFVLAFAILGAALLAPSSQASTAGMRLDRVSADLVEVSPGEVVVVRAHLTNTGAASDTFSVVAGGNFRYAVATEVASVTLASGEGIDVNYSFKAPADWFHTNLELRVTSANDPIVTRNLLTIVDTPVLLTVMGNDTRLSLTGQHVRGSVSAHYLDGQFLAGAAIDVQVALTTPAGARVPGSSATLTTGLSGVAYYDFDNALDRSPGRHLVTATFDRAGDAVPARATGGEYSVLT